MRQLVAGNWKMNGLASSLREIEHVRRSLHRLPSNADTLLCVPATLVTRAVDAAAGVFPIGGQDCAAEASGAFTGDISAEMLRDAGASAVIVGHSERRRIHGETSAIVNGKARAAHRAGLMAIICIGETEEERNAGAAHTVCARQLEESVPDETTSDKIAIAYEPVWAIGSTRTPSASDITDMHTHIRRCLGRRLGAGAEKTRILYGGSVNTSNAKTILALAEVDGALIGRASLRAKDHLAILASAKGAR